MLFQIREIILWPKNRNLESRRVPFELGRVNVITGASQTGKSAIVPIIDYCLGSGRCAIPVGIIREHTEWFGVLVQTTKGELLLARREPGLQQATSDMYLLEGNGHLDVPRYPIEAQALAQDPRVAWVEEDAEGNIQTFYTQSVTSLAWGLDRIDQRGRTLDATYSYNVKGTGVNVYVLDTGIHTTHVEFEGRAVGAYNAVPDGRTTDDCNGHGTNVAGIIGGKTYGVAKNVNLFAVRVASCGGGVAASDVISGLNWVFGNSYKPAVANLSLSMNAMNTSVDYYVQQLINSGVTVVVAAANNNVEACTQSPSDVKDAIVVGAIDNTDARWSSSNTGSCLDLFAPGVNITAAWGGPYSPTTGAASSDTSTAAYTGTSQATPHVTGAAALYLAGHPGADPRQVATALTANATANVLTGIGAGSPNLLLYEPFIAAVHFADLNADFMADGIALNDTSASLDSASHSWLPFVTAGYSPCAGQHATLMGDVNRDGMADVVCVNDNSIVVSLSTGVGYGPPQTWASNFSVYGDRATLLADVDHDGKADLVGISQQWGVWVSLSTGTGFTLPKQWAASPSVYIDSMPGYWGTHATLMADVNGDGRADIVAIDSAAILVSLSTGTAFGPLQIWANNFSVYGDRATALIDMDGDGRADLVGITTNYGTWIAYSNGAGFSAPQQKATFAIYGSVDTLVADVNGDGLGDLVAVDANYGIWVAYSWGGGFFNPQLLSSTPFYGTH